MLLYNLMFFIFSIITIFAALTVVLVKNPVHSVLWLIVAFFSSAGLFILLGAEFLAMVLIIVYVGAVAVLFLFVVMMLNIRFVQLKQGFNKFLSVGLLIGAIIFIDLYLAFNQSLEMKNTLAAPEVSMAASNLTNTHQIGAVLYTDYVYPFEIAGLILFVAMIGSIVLTLHHKKGVRRQNALAQNARDPKDAIEIKKVKSGRGVDV